MDIPKRIILKTCMRVKLVNWSYYPPHTINVLSPHTKNILLVREVYK
jgi:hypothetical protein